MAALPGIGLVRDVSTEFAIHTPIDCASDEQSSDEEFCDDDNLPPGWIRGEDESGEVYSSQICYLTYIHRHTRPKVTIHQ